MHASTQVRVLLRPEVRDHIGGQELLRGVLFTYVRPVTIVSARGLQNACTCTHAHMHTCTHAHMHT